MGWTTTRIRVDDKAGKKKRARESSAFLLSLSWRQLSQPLIIKLQAPPPPVSCFDYVFVSDSFLPQIPLL